VKARLALPTVGILSSCLFLLPEPLASQRPPTPGKLTVTSSQQAGITIDGQDTGQKTPSTFSVSPGNHSVSLPSLPLCKQPKPVSITSGSTTSVNCIATTGWSN
jgi:hypothetical protein